VQLVAGARHRDAADDLRVARRGGIEINDRDLVGDRRVGSKLAT